MRQQKQVHECPNCQAPLKKNRGPQSRKWYWICTRSVNCFKEAITS